MKTVDESNGGFEGRDDPRLTAYALDELEGGERETLERSLSGDATLAEEVRGLRELAGRVRGALADPGEARLDPARRAAVLGEVRSPAASRRWWLSPRMVAAAALLGTVGAVGYWCVRILVATESAARSPFTYSLYGDASAARPASALEGLGYLGYGAGGGRPVPSEELVRLGYGGDGAARPDFMNNDISGFVTRDELQGVASESYAPIDESGFRDPIREPLSTFSIDVDTASYANVRRFLSERRLPPADAVRIEELVNYFRYDYPEPRGELPFSVSVDAASAPWAPEHRLVRIGLLGRSIEDDLPRVKNLVFLVDVSGSMNDPAKLPLVQRSLRLLVDELADEDRVGLVVYAGRSGVVLPPTAARERGRILAAIDSLAAGGSTNGGAGIELAYSLAEEHFARDGVNRVVLATDGDFNVGITDRSELLRLIAAKAKGGVFLSVLGFGTGNLKDATMEQLADRGNGNYAYVDSLAEARKVLVREMGATLVTIAKDVKIQVEFNPARVGAYRLVGYENRLLAARDFEDDAKDAGEIGAGHTVTALYEIVPPELAASVAPLRYQTPAPGVAGGTGELLTVNLRYKQPDGERSELLSVPFTDEGRSFEAAAPDFRFAAAVAAFGMCLRDSEHRGAATLADVRRWAEPALGADPHGDRREFLRMVDVAAGFEHR